MLELQYAKFVNFKPFKINMNLTELEIVIPKGSDIIIINGENGSGKSTLMRALSPFGKPDGSSDIIEGVDGYKILKYYDKKTGIHYEINHVYTANKNGHSVQSHIIQINTDGSQEALNPNGNVGSFNDVLDRIFNINTKTRKLLNLSLEDKGLINLTTAERRNYVYSILPDMEEIDLHSKNVLIKYRVVNKEMEATKLKLSKYPDLERMKLDLADNEAKLDNLNASILELAEKMGKFAVMEEQYSEYTTRKESLCEKINNLIDSIQRWVNVNNMTDDMSENEPTDKILARLNEIRYNEDLNLQMKENEKLEIVSTIMSLTDSLQDADNVITALDEIKILRQNIETNADYALIDIPYTLDDFKEAEPYVSELTDVVGKALELVEDKQEFLNGILDDVDFIKLATDIDIDLFRMNGKQTELATILKNKRDSIAEYTNLGDSSTANCVCPIKSFIDSKINSVGDLDVIASELRELDVNIAILSEKLISARIMAEEQTAIKNAKFRLSTIEDNPIVKNLLLDLDSILCSGSIESRMTEFKIQKDLRAKYELYQGYLSRLKELSSFEKVTGIKSKDDIENEIISMKSNMESVEKIIAKSKDKLDTINKAVNELRAIDVTCIKMSYNDMNRLRFDTEKDVKELTILISELDNALEVKRQMEKDRKLIDAELIGYKNRITSLHNNINMVETLETEYQALILEERELGMVKDILRIKLPLKIMQHFLNVVKESANDFLINVGSRYKVSEFKLTDNEFIIEVINGTYVNEDISTMSSGEKSIISLALTFGMQNAILGNYKIMNLDEVDAPLDHENRKRYLDILFRQSHNYGIGQIFIVTHNDNFNDHADRIAVIALKGAHVRDEARIIYKYS